MTKPIIRSCYGRNKDQKLVGQFLKIRYFYKISIAIPLKMYSKFGRPKWILVGQMLKNCQWPTVISSTVIVKMPCKLLYVIQVKGFLIKCSTSWPYLISEFLVAYNHCGF